MSARRRFVAASKRPQPGGAPKGDQLLNIQLLVNTHAGIADHAARTEVNFARPGAAQELSHMDRAHFPAGHDGEMGAQRCHQLGDHGGPGECARRATAGEHPPDAKGHEGAARFHQIRGVVHRAVHDHIERASHGDEQAHRRFIDEPGRRQYPQNYTIRTGTIRLADIVPHDIELGGRVDKIPRTRTDQHHHRHIHR